MKACPGCKSVVKTQNEKKRDLPGSFVEVKPMPATIEIKYMYGFHL